MKKIDKYKPLEYDIDNPDLDIILENHKRLWKWLMKESIKTKTKVSKQSYFYTYYGERNICRNDCFLCEYIDKKYKQNILCKKICPINWGINKYDNEYYSCIGGSFYGKWWDCTSKNWIKASYYAWRISRLKLKKNYNKIVKKQEKIYKLIELINDGYKYIVRNKDNTIYVYKEQIVRDTDNGVWIFMTDDGQDFNTLYKEFNYDIEEVKWENIHAERIDTIIDKINREEDK